MHHLSESIINGGRKRELVPWLRVHREILTSLLHPFTSMAPQPQTHRHQVQLDSPGGNLYGVCLYAWSNWSAHTLDTPVPSGVFLGTGKGRKGEEGRVSNHQLLESHGC